MKLDKKNVIKILVISTISNFHFFLLIYKVYKHEIR